MRLALMTLVLFCSASAAEASSLLLNGSFESNVIVPKDVQLATGNNSALPGWAVTGACGSNCVLILDSTYTEVKAGYGTITFQAEDGNQAIDMTGSANSLVGGLSQNVTTTPGAGYTLSFFVGNMDDGAAGYTHASSVQLFIDGASKGVFSNDNNTSHRINWAQETLNFTATNTSTSIAFVNATPTGDSYAGLDNVDLELTSPEPATGLLGATIGLGIVLARRLRVSRG